MPSDYVFESPTGDPNGPSCMITCTDVTTRNDTTYREITVNIHGDTRAVVWYDTPIFKDDKSIETALQNVALALGARVSSVLVTRDERVDDTAAVLEG